MLIWWKVMLMEIPYTGVYSASFNHLMASIPDQLVVLDNASIHHLSTVVDLISAAGALVRFLPPYSPDMNPIEEAFSKVKSHLRDKQNMPVTLSKSNNQDNK